MAGSLNEVNLICRLARDPEARSFANGGKVVNLRVVTSETYKDKDGNRQEKAEFHSVAIFNEKLGEIAEKYLRKGSQVFLRGKLETRKWQDKDGQDRFTTEVVLRNFGGELTMLGGKGEGGSSEPAPQRQQQSRPVGGGKPAALDDDIPFAAEMR